MQASSNDTGSVCGRPFKSSLPSSVLAGIQAGTLKNTYRGRRFLKNPFDVVLYLRLLDRLRPRTVIEIGTHQGGSALWFADMLDAMNISSTVISVDRQPPTNLVDGRISFRSGDAISLESTLEAESLTKLSHPWLVIEDSAHTFPVCLAVLRFFDQYLAQGDYIVIEDGIVADLPGKVYENYANGPNRAVAAFLSERSNDYAIDTELCDHFGYNATYNPNGWLRRVRS